MEAQTKEKKPAATITKDVQTIITEQFIGLLEKGVVPWRTPWITGGVPTALVSRRPFRGINVLLLAALGYERNLFLTSKQLETLGGMLNKDERPHMVVFWDNPGNDQAQIGKKGGSLKYYLVYNVAQCDGLLSDSFPALSIVEDPIRTCEAIAAGVQNRPAVQHKGSTPHFDPMEDIVFMPKLKSYANPACYYSALFHQLAHGTGHHTRLDRMGLVQMSEYGCTPFTLEELVAEIVTSFLESHAGIPCPFEATPEYIEGWIKKLKADRYLIFTACTFAQKAIDFILNVKDSKEDE